MIGYKPLTPGISPKSAKNAELIHQSGYCCYQQFAKAFCHDYLTQYRIAIGYRLHANRKKPMSVACVYYL